MNVVYIGGSRGFVGLARTHLSILITLKTAVCNDIYKILFCFLAEYIIMVALCNRAEHYIFALWFLSSIFFISSPNLSGRRSDVYHTSTHGVALVRI